MELDQGFVKDVKIMGIFRTLGGKNFRLFFIGQGISLIGTWMQRIALPWIVYQQSGSALMLGLVALSGFAPSLLLAPVAGVLIDRWNRYHTVLAAQFLCLLQALLLACCNYSGVLTVGIIILLNSALGLINAFEVPARQAFLIELIDDKNDYCSAVAVNSTIVNGARLIGPSLAGIIMTRSGEGLCFLCNGASYLAVILALLMMKNLPVTNKPENNGFFLEMKEGLKYALSYKPLKNVLLLYGLICLAGWPCTILMPVIARDLLQGGAGTYALLLTASGAGALGGTFYFGSRRSNEGLHKLLAAATALLGLSIIVLSFSENLLQAMVGVSVIGTCMMVLMAASVSYVQSVSEDSKRGRMMSCYSMIFTGAAPLGSYLAGALSTGLGTPQTLFLAGIVCLVGAFAFSSNMNHGVTADNRNCCEKLTA